jgi:hypothetical protein
MDLTTEKLATLKRLAEEIANCISPQLKDSLSETGEGAALAAAKRRFDCGSYTCHGHFTCSNFGCTSQFKLAD